MEKRELVILGGGPAGLAAAIYARRAGLDVLLLERGVYGGQINITAEVENWPGTPHISGQELAQAFRTHAERFAPEFRDAVVTGMDFSEGQKKVLTNKGEIEGEAVIVATGAQFKRLGCAGEAKFTGRGVSYCAVCDAPFFEGEPVAVIGGGNTAVEEAVYLTQFASKVYIVHRRDAFRADRLATERALSNPKIIPVWNSVVQSIEGNDMVEKIVLKNVRTGGLSELSVSGVFVFVGMEPNNPFIRDLVETRPGGWIVTNEQMETSLEGVFAAGDVRDKPLRQVVTAASDGAVAAMAAYSYISQQLHLQSLLFEPRSVFAFLSSSVDPQQISLTSELEEWQKDPAAPRVVLIDGYKNARMTEKLGVKTLPALLELEGGKVVRTCQPMTLEEVKKFCRD